MFGSVPYPLLYPQCKPNGAFMKLEKRRLNMTSKKSILIRGLLVGTLLLPAASALADDNKHDGDHHWSHDGKNGHHGRGEKQYYRRNVHHEKRGNHNKPEIRQDFKDVRSERSVFK